MAARLLSLLLLFAAAACASAPTPYQPRGASGGYADQRLDDRTWRVQFQGNFSTPRDVVQNFVLLRAAEIMLANGYEQFGILEQDVERTTDYNVYYDYPYCDSYPYYKGRPYRVSDCYWPGVYASPGFYSESYYADFSRYTAYATVRAIVPGQPPVAGQIYNASEIVRQLGPTTGAPG